MKKWFLYTFLVFFFIFFFTGDIGAQCSQCKLLATHSGNTIDDKILDYHDGNNINTAILYIMLAPYLLMGIAVVILRKRVRKLYYSVFYKEKLSSDSE